MHELPVTQSILDIANQRAQEAGARRVTDLYLVIGRLSSVVDDSVQFYWDLLAEGTLCEGATLHFRRLPVVLHCRECEVDYELPDGELKPCPHCRGTRVDVRQGDEFLLDSIEIEREEESAAEEPEGAQ